MWNIFLFLLYLGKNMELTDSMMQGDFLLRCSSFTHPFCGEVVAEGT